MDGIHDPGARLHAIISFLPHHPLLPIWAQCGPDRSTCGPHHIYTTNRPCAALHLLCGFLHPSAKSTDSHDEWHPLEGGPGARWALEDTGIPHIWTERMHWKNVNINMQTHLTIMSWSQRKWCCLGGGYNFDAREEAASLPMASTWGVWAQLWPEGALVSQVRQ